MPTAEFPIAVNADDRQTNLESAGYPPSGTATITDGNFSSPHRTWSSTSSTYVVRCALLRWDTSSLPDDATITGATLRIFLTGKGTADSLVVSADWYAWTGVAADHSNTPQSGALASYDPTGLTNDTLQDIPLNNAAANISKTGYTYLRLHMSQRASDAAPTGTNQMQFATKNNTTYNSPAVLIVAYDEGVQTEELRPDAILLQTNDTKTLSDLQRDVP